MNPLQARAARYALRFTAKEVAAGSGVSDFTVKRFEKGGEKTNQTTIEAMKDFYCSHGVTFIEHDEKHGVMFEPDSKIMPPRSHPR